MWDYRRRKQAAGASCPSADAKAQDLRRVRESLGLGDGNSLLTTKALQPLTRQEVRRLIDKNIAALNAHRSEGNKLQTYAQLHARYSEQEKKDIRETRKTINRTGTGPGIELNTELADLLAVIKANPSFEGLSEADAEYYLEFIDELTTALERVRDDDERYNWERENRTEHKVTVTGGATGMAIALDDGGNVVVETHNNGKRSRIPLGLTPGELDERLEHAHVLLNRITTLEVDDKIKLGKDNADESALEDAVSVKFQAGKSLDESGIQDAGNIFADLSQPNAIRPDIRQSDAARENLSFRDDPEIKEEEPSPEARKRTAKQNLDTIASLMAKQYDFGMDVATGILKQIDGWEERLAECSTSGHPTNLGELNEDLREFLMGNLDTIQPLIDQAIADKA